MFGFRLIKSMKRPQILDIPLQGWSLEQISASLQFIAAHYYLNSFVYCTCVVALTQIQNWESFLLPTDRITFRFTDYRVKPFWWCRGDFVYHVTRIDYALQKRLVITAVSLNLIRVCFSFLSDSTSWNSGCSPWNIGIILRVPSSGL